MLITQLGLGSTFAQGAKKSTSQAPMIPDNIDFYGATFATKTRKEIKYLNANTTEIPAIIENDTLLTIGVSVNTQVETDDLEFNNAAEKIIRYHEKIGVGEITNKYNGNSAKKAMSSFDLLNGGIIVVHHYNMAWNFPYKYEIVSVDMVDTSKNTYIYDDNNRRITNGIEFNKYNQPTAIYMYSNRTRTVSKRISMKNITYYSEVWITLGQQLAVSKLISMLPTLDRLDQYQKAELDAAIESAKAGGYLKTGAFEEIMHLVKEEIDSMGGQDYDKKKDLYKTVLENLSKIGVKPYGVTPIPSSDDVIFNTKENSSIYESMSDNSERKMASSLGHSQLTTFKRVDKVNYSAGKLALEFSKLKSDSRFDNLKDVFNEINKRILMIAVQTGRLKRPKNFFERIDEFLSFRYIRRRFVDIEPGKTASGNEKNIKMGVVTERQLIEERHGIPYEEFLINKKRDEDIKRQILGEDTDENRLS